MSKPHVSPEKNTHEATQWSMDTVCDTFVAVLELEDALPSQKGWLEKLSGRSAVALPWVLMPLQPCSSSACIKEAASIKASCSSPAYAQKVQHYTRGVPSSHVEVLIYSPVSIHHPLKTFAKFCSLLCMQILRCHPDN